MDAAVRHAVHCVGLPITTAVIAAATTPATVLGIADRTGSIHPGKDADIVIASDRLRVEAVLARGAVTHGALP
jgi:N-acetylglucosamine-6-phosphate deacetylase